MSRAVLIGLLLVGLLAAVPMAYASPPDQTWLGGWYDDADYDDVVLAVTSAVGTVNSALTATLRPLPVIVDVVHSLPRSRHASGDFLFVPLRAPPLG